MPATPCPTAAGAPRIVALTGRGQLDDLRRSREAGCDAHLVKPVTPEAVLEELAGEPTR
ncbi:hypothetical protein WME91_29930 [Sorangium sp. So ce269]